jgi:hypothetical protein
MAFQQRTNAGAHDIVIIRNQDAEWLRRRALIVEMAGYRLRRDRRHRDWRHTNILGDWFSAEKRLAATDNRSGFRNADTTRPRHKARLASGLFLVLINITH